MKYDVSFLCRLGITIEAQSKEEAQERGEVLLGEIIENANEESLGVQGAWLLEPRNETSVSVSNED